MFLRILIVLFSIIDVWLITWCVGQRFGWDWSNFWSNFISNTGANVITALVLYWMITRRDEKKAINERRSQALAMLKNEFRTNLERVKLYSVALETPEQDLTPYLPLRLTRGAWNALKESGFLPQLTDINLVYALLQLNETIVVANKTLLSIRNAKSKENTKLKVKKLAKKAIRECSQVEKYLDATMAILDKMELPEITPLPENSFEDNEVDEGEDEIEQETSK